MNETLDTSMSQSLTPLRFLEKTFTSGKKMLFIVIAYAVSLVSGLISACSVGYPFSSILAYINAVISETGTPVDASVTETLAQLEAIAETVDVTLFIMGFIALIPTALIACGAFFIYNGAVNKDASKASLGTLLIRILFIYQFVVCMLGLALTLLCTVLLSASAPDYIALFAIIAVILAIPVVLTAIYYGKFGKMFKNLGESVRTGENKLKVYSYVTVINWIVAVSSILSAVSSLASDFIGTISTIFSAVSLIFVTMLFSEYKEEMGDPDVENN